MPFEIYNKTQGTYLVRNATIANSFFKRLKGLLGKGRLDEDEALIIYPCNSIHTIGMRFPIDVLFLDNEGRAIKIVHSLQPFRINGFLRDAKAIVELPEGVLKKTKTTIGDVISTRSSLREAQTQVGQVHL